MSEPCTRYWHAWRKLTHTHAIIIYAIAPIFWKQIEPHCTRDECNESFSFKPCKRVIFDTDFMLQRHSLGGLGRGYKNSPTRGVSTLLFVDGSRQLNHYTLTLTDKMPTNWTQSIGRKHSALSPQRSRSSDRFCTVYARVQGNRRDRRNESFHR